MYFVHDISSMRYVASRQREKGIYIISQSNEVRLYRIYKVNISHERERVYRQNICCIYYVRESHKESLVVTITTRILLCKKQIVWCRTRPIYSNFNGRLLVGFLIFQVGWSADRGFFFLNFKYVFWCVILIISLKKLAETISVNAFCFGYLLYFRKLFCVPGGKIKF